MRDFRCKRTVALEPDLHASGHRTISGVLKWCGYILIALHPVIVYDLTSCWKERRGAGDVLF
jgi:hypothetical protein